jgi:hypothetical protein
VITWIQDAEQFLVEENARLSKNNAVLFDIAGHLVKVLDQLEQSQNHH